MNWTIKAGAVRRFHYDSPGRLGTHLAGFINAYHPIRRIKTLSGLKPYEYIAKIWTPDPNRLIDDPIHQMPELSI